MEHTMKSLATYTSQYGSVSQGQGVFQHCTVGAVKETMDREYRVALTPDVAREFVQNGHTVYVQSNFASHAGFTNQEYQTAGAHILGTAVEVYKMCSIIMKVNRPQPEEYGFIQPNQVIFCFTEQQGSSHSDFVKHMVERRAVILSYNFLSGFPGSYPVCDCTGELAGFLAVQQAMMMMGSSGTCFGQLSWLPGSSVLILGATPCGIRAAAFASGAGARVTLMDSSMESLRLASERLTGVTTMAYTAENLEKMLPLTTALFGCVLPPFGGSAPVLVSESQMRLMRPGSIAIDLASSLGGNFSTTKPLTIQSPTYSWEGITLYTATDITCLAPKAASFGIAHAVMPFSLQVANKGWKKAVMDCAALQLSVYAAEGSLTNGAAALTAKLTYTPIESVIQTEIQQIASSQQQQQQQQLLLSLKQQLSSFRSQTGVQSGWTIEA